MFFFFNDTATTEIYTLSLHDALPISWGRQRHLADSLIHREMLRRMECRSAGRVVAVADLPLSLLLAGSADRKSTRLNSSHANISYAVFCLKKKTNLLFPLSLHTSGTP